MNYYQVETILELIEKHERSREIRNIGIKLDFDRHFIRVFTYFTSNYM